MVSGRLRNKQVGNSEWLVIVFGISKGNINRDQGLKMQAFGIMNFSIGITTGLLIVIMLDKICLIILYFSIFAQHFCHNALEFRGYFAVGSKGRWLMFQHRDD